MCCEQTGATGVGEVPRLKRFKLQFRERRGGTAVGPCGGQSGQPGQSAQEAKGMLGIVFSLPPHLNIGSQQSEAVCFDTLNIWRRKKRADPPYMIIGSDNGHVGGPTSGLTLSAVWIHLDTSASDWERRQSFLFLHRYSVTTRPPPFFLSPFLGGFVYLLQILHQ